MTKNSKRILIVALIVVASIGLIYALTAKKTLKAGDKRTYEHPLGGTYELVIDKVEEIDETNQYEKDVKHVIAVTYTFKNIDYKGDMFLNVNEDNWKCCDKEGNELALYNIGYAGHYTNSQLAEKGKSVTKTVLYGIDSDEKFIKLVTRDKDIDTKKPITIELTW